ncbi:cytochrome P450 4C1-like [Folsomia candida]|nr:cytochrome P450 4C1-like [Folsomia candida]
MFGSRMSRLLGKFPGPPLVPCAGNAYLFLGPPKNVLPTIAGLIKKYGRRFRLWKFHNPYVILVDGKDIEHVLSSNQHINKGRDYHQLHWMNGNGLITSGGDVWREDRKLLNPSFKYQRFDGFLDSFNKNGKILVSVLKKYFKNGDQKVDLHPALCRCTMDTIFESVLGATFNIQSESSEGYVGEGHVMYEGLKSVMMSYRTRGLKPWLCLPIVRNILGIAKIERETKKNFTKFMIKVIDGRKKSLKNNPGDDASRAFIDVLLESRSNQNLVDHAFTIFAAAFETNATAMNFLLFLLALNPACQKKVHQELDEVFNGDRRDATAKDIKELKYMEMCILETMRHFPPAPMFSRNLETDIVLDDGTLVPKGADVGIFVYEVHNDPAVFPHPEKFDPDRFLPAEVKKRHNYSYIPFSKGPRSCIGQKYAMLQMKSVLSHVLREFSVTTKMTRKDVNIIIGSIIEIDCSIFLTLSPRCGPKTMYKF